MPVIRDPDFIDYGEYDVNSPPIDPYTASKNNAGEAAQLLIDYDDRKFALTAPKYGEIGVGNTNLVGYGGTGGVTGQALYSKFKKIWKEDNLAVKFPFPMEAITPESFEFINGWEPDDTTELDYFTTQGITTAPAITRKLIKDCGWAERTTIADGNVIKRKFFGVITLGAISRPFNDSNDARVDARIYCSQLVPGIGTDFVTDAIIDADDRILVQGPSAGSADDVTVPDMWTGNSIVYQQPTAVSQGIGLTHNTLYYMRYEGNGPFALDGARPGGNTVGVATNGYRLALYSTQEGALNGNAVDKVALTVGAGDSVGRIRNQSPVPTFFFDITEEGGAANESFKFYETAGAPDYRVLYNYDNFFRIYSREKGRTYADQSISQVGVTQINSQAYRIPLTTSADANLSINQIEVSDQSVSDEGNDFYSGIGVSFFQAPIDISINDIDYKFNCVIDANFKTLPAVYQRVQYLLRNPSNINTRVIDGSAVEVGYGFTSINSLSAVGGPSDVGFGTVGAGDQYLNDLRFGATEDQLLEFVGTNLFAKLRDDIFDETEGASNYGIFIKDVQNDDLNRVFYFDNTGTRREQPFVSSFNLVFNTNLNEDNDARFWVFFDRDRGSNSEPLAGLSTDITMENVGDADVTDGIIDAEDRIVFGAGDRSNHPFVNGQAVVAIATVTSPGIGIQCETEEVGIVTYQLSREGSSYYNVVKIPDGYAGRSISSETRNPELYVYGVGTAEFDLDTLGGGGVGHPFFIKEGNALIDGQFIGGSDGAIDPPTVINNGAISGIVTFVPNAVAGGSAKNYYYICGDHPAMRGNITILDILQDSAFVYYVNAIKPSTGIGQTYRDIIETNDNYPLRGGVGAATSFKLHTTYLDAVANGGIGINTIALAPASGNTGLITFTQVDINYEENNATVVRTSKNQAAQEGGPLAYLDGVDVPSDGEFGLTFDYDFNSQRNRQNGTDAKCKVISIGLEKGQFVSQDFTITRNKGVTVQVAGALERVYNDPEV